MKNRNLWKVAVGLGLMGLPFAGGCLQQKGQPATESGGSTTAAETAAPPGPVISGGAIATEGVAVPDDTPALTNLVEAQVVPISTNQPVPAKVQLTPAAAELLKLANSGVDQSVMLAYVTNSTSTFNLSAEEIIYLNDLGVPGPVVTAMIQRDQVLKAEGRAALLSSSPPVTSLPAPEPVQPAPTAVTAPLTPPDYPTEPPPAPPAEEVSAPVFYDSLAPYGTWVDVTGYGRCWRPTVAVVNPVWQPYYDGGHWVYTDCGWYWMSDYSWGWAPFHYGRWFRHNHWGWCWAPGTVWGPSWVAWRYSDAYCGWAPLPPGAYFSFSLGLTFHGHRVHDWDDCGLHPGHYRFVAWSHFDDHHVNHYGVPPHQVDSIYRNTVVVNRITVNNNTVINQGLPRDRVAAATRHDLRPVAIHATADAGRSVSGRAERLSGRTLTVYRPNLPQRGRDGEATAANRGAVVRGGNRAGNAPSTMSAPLAERAPAPGAGTTTAPSRGSAAPPVVRNGNENGVGPASTTTSSGGNRFAAPSRQGTSTTVRSGTALTPGTRSVTTPVAPSTRTATTTPAPTYRNADPATRFDRIQPPARTVETPRQSTYQPAPSAQVPRYNPAPSYSPPASAPSRSYSPPAAAPSRSYSPPPSAPARSYSPPPSAPSRSYSPQPSYSPPSAPARSYSPPPSSPAPSRSYSPPAPSAPRSDPAPSRSSPPPSSRSDNNSGGGRQR